MSLIFRCPECQEYVKVSATLAGLHAHCPSCNVSVPVPDHDMPPDAETATHLWAKKKWEAIASQTAPSATAAPPLLAWLLAGAFVLVMGAIVFVAFALR